MEDNTGKISISLSNGSLRANSLAKVSDMQLTFCDATINYMQEGNINTSFSEISIGESGNLNIAYTLDGVNILHGSNGVGPSESCRCFYNA